MKSFLQGKRALSVVALRPPAGPSSPPVPGRPAAASPVVGASGARGASVETIKEGDKVVRLVVTCACGEKVEIECLYPAGS